MHVHSHDMKTQHIKFEILNERLCLFYCNFIQHNFVHNMFSIGQIHTRLTMYYISALIHDFLYWCLYGIVLEALRSVLETLRCVGDHVNVLIFLCFLNTGSVIPSKTTHNSYDSTVILLQDVKRLKISMRDRFV